MDYLLAASFENGSSGVALCLLLLLCETGNTAHFLVLPGSSSSNILEGGKNNSSNIVRILMSRANKHTHV